jgi:phage shock protein PspC (stress-responsive transcriptional regulator)
MDPTLLRVLFLVAFVMFGTGLLIYLILALAMPNPEDAQQ